MCHHQTNSSIYPKERATLAAMTGSKRKIFRVRWHRSTWEARQSCSSTWTDTWFHRICHASKLQEQSTRAPTCSWVGWHSSSFQGCYRCHAAGIFSMVFVGNLTFLKGNLFSWNAHIRIQTSTIFNLVPAWSMRLIHAAATSEANKSHGYAVHEF